MADQRNVSYDDTSSGCMTLLDGDGDATSFLGCVLGCLERPPEDDNERKPSQAAGDLLARAETEERRGAYGAASELYRRALRLDPANATAHNNFGYLSSGFKIRKIETENAQDGFPAPGRWSRVSSRAAWVPGAALARLKA